MEIREKLRTVFLYICIPQSCIVVLTVGITIGIAFFGYSISRNLSLVSIAVAAGGCLCLFAVGITFYLIIKRITRDKKLVNGFCCLIFLAIGIVLVSTFSFWMQ
jgi:O-antigen/teichoic acid export membrane protein